MEFNYFWIKKINDINIIWVMLTSVPRPWLRKPKQESFKFENNTF